MVERGKFHRGIGITKAAITACKDQFWHYELYRFLYAHYQVNLLMIEVMSKNGSELQLKIHKKILDRVLQVLITIVSPYIARFLKNADALLYLKYLERNKKIREYCQESHSIVSNCGVGYKSVIPLYDNNGTWECADLNFQQLNIIIKRAYSLLSGKKLMEPM